MADKFLSNAPGLSSPATLHFAITAADANLENIPRAIYVNSGGTLVIRDAAGTDVTYTVASGQIIPFRGVQVRAASTASVVGWY